MAFAEDPAPPIEPELGELHRRYATWLARMVRRGGKADAEDVVQETFIRASAYGAEELLRHPRALLLKIARSVVLNTARDASRKKRDPTGYSPEVWESADQYQNAGDVREDPAVADALRQAKARIALTRKKEGLPFSVTMTALVGLVVAGVVIGTAILTPPAAQRYQTAVGEQRRVTLPDGSSMDLDTASVVDVRFSRGERLVRLISGQAMFDVVHRPDRPFRVEADDLQVRDIGTVFDVRRDEGHAVVTVVSGEVRVDAGAGRAPWTLSAGQQLGSGSVSGPRSVDVAAFTRWTNGRVEFDDVPLAAAVREMNRYAPHPLLLEGPAVGQLHVSGAFDTSDLKGFVKALTAVYGVEVKPAADGQLVISASPSTRA